MRSYMIFMMVEVLIMIFLVSKGKGSLREMGWSIFLTLYFLYRYLNKVFENVLKIYEVLFYFIYFL